MFERDNEIYRIDAKGKFLSVKEAFGLLFNEYNNKPGKPMIKFEFGTYDQNNKIVNRIDYYMNIDEFAYFCKILEDGRIEKALQVSVRKRNEAVKAGTLQMKANGSMPDPEPAFMRFKGTSKSKVFSIVESVSKNCNIAFKCEEGPGKKGKTGQMQPDYGARNAGNYKYIIIPASNEHAIGLALAGTRAIRIYDNWISNGTLKRNLIRIGSIKSENAQQQASQNYSAPAPNMNSNPSGYVAQNSQPVMANTMQEAPQYNEQFSVYDELLPDAIRMDPPRQVQMQPVSSPSGAGARIVGRGAASQGNAYIPQFPSGTQEKANGMMRGYIRKS